MAVVKFLTSSKSVSQTAPKHKISFSALVPDNGVVALSTKVDNPMKWDKLPIRDVSLPRGQRNLLQSCETVFIPYGKVTLLAGTRVPHEPIIDVFAGA